MIPAYFDDPCVHFFVGHVVVVVVVVVVPVGQQQHKRIVLIQ